MNDIVTISCYGKEEKMSRLDAMKKYQECVLCSEGSERDRYVNILVALLNGDKYCSDRDDLY